MKSSSQWAQRVEGKGEEKKDYRGINLIDIYHDKKIILGAKCD